MPEYQRFPLWMHHPHEQPAVLSDDYGGPQGTRPALGYGAPAGRARRFPPVMVQNAEQEAYHASQGYEPGQSSKAAFEKAPLPSGYQQQEYPKIVNGLVVQDPNAPPPVDPNYPKWVDLPDGSQKLVNNQAEERALVGEPPEPEMSVAEREFLDALNEAQREQDTAGTEGDLLLLALSLGIKADKRWGDRRLREAIDEIEKATAP